LKVRGKAGAKQQLGWFAKFRKNASSLPLGVDRSPAPLEYQAFVKQAYNAIFTFLPLSGLFSPKGYCLSFESS
jgi:hypothetical protein